MEQSAPAGDDTPRASPRAVDEAVENGSKVPNPVSSVEDQIDSAAGAALARARDAARAAGLRPGVGGRPRRRPRPTPVEFSSARADGRDPVSLSDQWERLLSERGWQADVAVGSVIARWPAVVGPEVAQHVTPEKFEDGVLVVRTDSTSWATNVRIFVPQWLERLQEEAGADTIHEVRVIGPAAPSWRKGHRLAPGSRGPRDTYG